MPTTVEPAAVTASFSTPLSIIYIQHFRGKYLFNSFAIDSIIIPSRCVLQHPDSFDRGAWTSVSRREVFGAVVIMGCPFLNLRV